MAEDVTYVGDFRDACTLAAQSLRDLDAEQPLLTDFGKRFLGEARFRIDCRSGHFRHVGSGTRARRQIVVADIDYPGDPWDALRFHRNSLLAWRQSRGHYAETPRDGQSVNYRPNAS